MRSKPAAKGTAAAAQEAARRAFKAPSSLPLNEDTLAHAKAIEGRQRLTGAFLIELDRIQPDPAQPRKAMDLNAQYELAASIKQLGILQPISVRYLPDEDVYRIISGERRYQAAKSLGLPAIPCWVRTPKTEQVLIHQVVENWQRLDLEPFEIADALAALKSANGYTQRQVAELTGKSEGDVSKLLALLDLAPDAQHLARNDASTRLSRRHLYAALKLPAAEQRAFLERVLDTAMTADAADAQTAPRKTAARTSSKRGAPVTRIRFTTSSASVILTFRRKQVTPQDVIAALDDARRQVHEKGRQSTLNIVRPN